jgi:hypothetical protein
MIYSSPFGENVGTFLCPLVGLNSGHHPAPYFLDDACCFLHENAFVARGSLGGK